jgi:hypothetical protein
MIDIKMSSIEAAILHEIIEDYEGSGMRLHLLVYFIHFYFSKADSTIADIYQVALDTLALLERKGAIQLVKQTYKKIDDSQWQVVAENLVPKELVPEVLRHPKTWSSDTVYADGVYLYIPTDEGI